MKITQAKHTLFKTFVLIFLFFCNYNVFSQTTYIIDDPEKLEDETYIAGDIIILKNGTYDTEARIDFVGNGTADNPIIFRAETPGGVVFTNGLKMDIGGDYVVVDGFLWRGGYGASNFIQFRNGDDYANHSTIQNCAIDGLGIDPDDLAEDLADEQITKHRWIVLYGTYNTVINCSFMNKVSAGAIVLGEYSYNAFPEVPDGEPEINNSCAVVGHTIMNNYFYNFEKLTELYGRKANGDELSNAGDSETIRIGTSSYQMVNSDAVVSNNYFVQSDGENEIITNKSKGNTYTNNTFRRCRGSLVLRHGSKATVDGNYFLGEDVDGTGGIRISDSYHTITNNYIQDCITVDDYAKWNNGITFIGGGANANVECTSDNISNGYQKTADIILSNNTIINTNAPLFYTVNIENKTDVKGVVENNLIYFEANDPNLTTVISGDTPTSYDDIGATLTYTGNVYTGTTLGETNAGFSEETGIMAAADGEIFTFSGSGSAGKGADMNAYAPTTDAMVGYGIGACFLDYSGANIIGGDCTIEVLESLTVSSLSPLSPDAGSYDVTLTANVSWTAASNDGWISIDTNSGTSNATVSVTVTENVDDSSRIGTVTFAQVEGGGDIVRTLTVTQEGADPKDNLDLINDGTINDNVSINYVFSEEVDPNKGKNNIAEHSLDKNFDTQWSGEGVAGDIIFDLGGTFDLALIDYASTNGKRYEFQIWVSSTGTDENDFTNPFSGQGNLVCETQNDEFKSFLFPSVAAGISYVKIRGYGQPARPSDWNTIVEIEFYGTQNLSKDDIIKHDIFIYPVPAKDVLHISNLNHLIDGISVHSLDGRKVIERMISNATNFSLNTSSFAQGVYIINFMNENVVKNSKMIVISK